MLVLRLKHLLASIFLGVLIGTSGGVAAGFALGSDAEASTAVEVAPMPTSAGLGGPPRGISGTQHTASVSSGRAAAQGVTGFGFVLVQTSVEISATVSIRLNSPPDCSTASSSLGSIWPPDLAMVHGIISGITDADGDTVRTAITKIEQDEPVQGSGDGNASPDGVIDRGGRFQVRAERAGAGDGRVYFISFEGTDEFGATCVGSATAEVPHDREGDAVDSGDRFDSSALE